ncbi:hypothetical protein HKCCE2091_05680 [Rhodobacterales bacterium HKCCE2091]|nr:hypothetical protein [Rhodobacterales bacterium HKCCE2091]
MPGRAADMLERAFARGAAGAGDGPGRVGLFGDGVPLALVAAAGGVALDVKLAPPDPVPLHPAVAAVVEPFVDTFAARFLHRLAAGAYDGFAVLVFARDDAAALVAYQYAAELRRQGALPPGPPLHLWNLVHTDSAPAHAFNMTEAARLRAALSAHLDATGAPSLAEALAQEDVRRAALARLDAASVSARVAHVWRNAGRYLSPLVHAEALDAALAEEPRIEGDRIGLVGSAIGTAALHDLIDRPVRDLTPTGACWPGPAPATPDLEAVIRAAATDPLHPRAAPAGRHRAALVDRLAGCAAVVAQCAEHEEAFGWDIPPLREALAARGIPLIDLGLRPEPPDEAWLGAARARLAAAKVPA